MQSLVALSEEKGYSIYLLGAKQKVVEETSEVLKKRHPNLKVAGIHNGYFKENDWPDISAELKDKNRISFCWNNIANERILD